MFKSNFILDSPDKVAAAIHNQTPIIVYQTGVILDYGGIIESGTEDSVTIGECKYLNAVCEFKVR